MTTKDIKFTLSVNAFEMGVLMSLIMQADKHTRDSLPDTWQQLVATKKQIERECGVRKEYLPGGKLKITDADGNVIIRPPYSWEVEGN